MGLLVGIFLLPLSLQARNSLPGMFKLELGSPALRWRTGEHPGPGPLLMANYQQAGLAKAQKESQPADGSYAETGVDWSPLRASPMGMRLPQRSHSPHLLLM